MDGITAGEFGVMRPLAPVGRVEEVAVVIGTGGSAAMVDS